MTDKLAKPPIDPIKRQVYKLDAPIRINQHFLKEILFGKEKKNDN